MTCKHGHFDCAAREGGACTDENRKPQITESQAEAAVDAILMRRLAVSNAYRYAYSPAAADAVEERIAQEEWAKLEARYEIV